MTYHYTYNITLLKGSLKDHYYYGQHTTDNLDDGYAGSGKMLQNYYKKYGAIENVTYTKTIIDFYSSSTELNEAEYELIGDKYETDPMCLNLVAGGNHHFGGEKFKQIMSEATRGEKNGMYGKHHSNEAKSKLHNYRIGTKQTQETKDKISKSCSGEKNGFYNKHHTEETIQKIRNKLKGTTLKQETKDKISLGTRGEKNGMYGKHHSDEAKSKMHNNKGAKYVNNGIEERMVKGEKLQQLLNEGYVYGRLKRNKNTQ